MAATRRLRYAPSGPFSDDSGDGGGSLYSVDTDGTVQTDPETPLTVQTWTVPVGAGGGAFLLEWYCEVTSNADTETDPAAIGTVSLEADGTPVSLATINQVGGSDPAPWLQASGFAVRTLADGDVVNLIVSPGDLEAVQLSARRRRITATPVTVLT